MKEVIKNSTNATEKLKTMGMQETLEAMEGLISKDQRVETVEDQSDDDEDKKEDKDKKQESEKPKNDDQKGNIIHTFIKSLKYHNLDEEEVDEDEIYEKEVFRELVEHAKKHNKVLIRLMNLR